MSHFVTFIFFPLLVLFLSLPWQGDSLRKKDYRRKIPSPDNHDFYLETPIGPFLDVLFDTPLEAMIRATNDEAELDKISEAAYNKAKKELEAGDPASTTHYIKIAKNPHHKHAHKYETPEKVPFIPYIPFFEGKALWFFHFKGKPLSLIGVCTLILPILFAGLLQKSINFCCVRGTASESRRKYEFPIVPVLLLQQTRREYFLRKKTVRRFCIQWEVGRINIRMNTRLVDLRQILHPPKKRKKIHKYTTWRIIRLIVRFNAFLALRRKNESRHEIRFKSRIMKRGQTWHSKVNSSQYLIEKKVYDEFKDTDK